MRPAHCCYGAEFSLELADGLFEEVAQGRLEGLVVQGPSIESSKTVSAAEGFLDAQETWS